MISETDSTAAPSDPWLALRDDLKVLLDFACGANHTNNVDQSQIDVAARLILLDRPAGDKDWADAYKAVDYFTRIIGPATLEGVAVEAEARRHEAATGAYRISLPMLTGARGRRGAPYMHGYRLETMRFCILTLLLLVAAIYAHSKIIPAQTLLREIDDQAKSLLKLTERISIVEQTMRASADPAKPAAADATSQLQIQKDALQGERHDRSVDMCFRQAYLKSWYLNQSLATAASWIPFNRFCAIAEDEVRKYCNGEARNVPCHDDGPPAEGRPYAVPATLEQTNEHVIRAHVDTVIRIWLPALYGALGACLWVIRERYAQIKEVRVSRTRVVSRTSRLMLGAGTGSIVHMFQPLLPQGYEAVSLPALAFLVGYNVEFVFALADEFIKRFAGNQPQR